MERSRPLTSWTTPFRTPKILQKYHANAFSSKLQETPASTSTDISGADSTSGATAEAVVADALGEQEVAGKKSPVDELDDAIEDSKDLAKVN